MKGFKTEQAAYLAVLRTLAGNLEVPELYFGDNEDCSDVFGASIAEQFNQQGRWFVQFQDTWIVSNNESDVLEWALEFAGTPADICVFEQDGKWFAEVRDWS